MKKTWILVANQAEAQFYSSDRLPGNLMLIDVLENKEGTSRARDLVSDAPGRAFDSTGSGRHAMEPNTGVKEEQRRRFVKEMVERLQTTQSRGGFDKLVLLAAPAVLGVIRKTLPADLTKIVVKEIPKDVIGQGVDKIQLQLERAFALQ